MVDLKKFKKDGLPILENFIPFIEKIKPDKISIEETNESIFFTLIKKDYVFYIDIYIDNKEALLVIFKNDIKKNSFSGDIKYIKNVIKDKINE